MSYICKAISAALRSKAILFLTFASNAITTLHMLRGRTMHSRFCTPLNVDDWSSCYINPKSPLVELIAKSKLIIWDEVPMMHEHCFEAVELIVHLGIFFENQTMKICIFLLVEKLFYLVEIFGKFYWLSWKQLGKKLFMHLSIIHIF